jgi:6,7-dimethyl-8-ribityllumazine synthase
MAREHKGTLDGRGKKFALVASRFSRVITDQLVGGAIECLTQHGADPDAIEVFWVPGSFELPLVVRRVAGGGDFDAVIALGCIIRGQTPHFEYIARTVSGGLAEIAQDTGVPVAFGVITAETMEQAIERAGIKTSGRGWEAALSALEMADLLGSLAKGAASKRGARKARD